MKLVDADELIQRIEYEAKILDVIFSAQDEANLLWQRNNEIVRIKSIIAKMPEVEKEA